MLKLALFGAVALFFAAQASAAEQTATARPLSFVNDIEPILTKAGCNAGACHAKAVTGQRGFRLSVLGFDPEEDYEAIVKQSKGRRVFPPAPEESLIVMKAASIVPHTGGQRILLGSPEYKTLVRWITEGLNYASADEPKVTRLEVEPSRETMKVNTQQQLKVTAHYSDGSTRDVTQMALYEANDKSMAEASDTGLVKVLDIPGNVAVMVRYSALVSVCSISIPLGAPVPEVPPSKNYIDDFVFSNLQQIGVPPSPICDDATFLRRVTLDIAGRLPTTEETGAFLAAKDADKRDRVIDTLIASPDYADYFANKWSTLLKNKRDDAADITANFAFFDWLRDNLLANTPYDQIVRQILASTGTITTNPPVAWYKRVKEPTTQLEDVAQLFLGVRMQCAQCHHHPFEKWSQTDYYRFSAFFSQIGRKPTATKGEDLIFHQRGLAQAEQRKTHEMLKPAGLGQPPLDIAPDEDPRLKLVDWMADKSNPFFAKELVNRYWKHFFKRGLVEPEDDMRDTNPATNPELLDALAKHFIESGYDLKSVVRTIAQSHTYQLSSQPNEYNAVDRQAFSHYYPKRMTAEVMLDSIDMVTGTKSDFPDLPPGTRAIALPDNSYNRTSPFLKVFGRPEATSVCECERTQSASLAQSLYLMNAADIKAKLTAPTGRAAQLAKPGMPDTDCIRQVYLAALSRPPTEKELNIAEGHVAYPRTDAEGKPLDPQRSRRDGFEDLLWAVLNTKEFLYNH